VHKHVCTLTAYLWDILTLASPVHINQQPPRHLASWWVLSTDTVPSNLNEASSDLLDVSYSSQPVTGFNLPCWTCQPRQRAMYIQVLWCQRTLMADSVQWPACITLWVVALDRRNCSLISIHNYCSHTINAASNPLHNHTHTLHRTQHRDNTIHHHTHTLHQTQQTDNTIHHHIHTPCTGLSRQITLYTITHTHTPCTGLTRQITLYTITHTHLAPDSADR